MKIFKSLIPMALIAVAASFSACNEDGYWDAAPAGANATYTFLAARQSHSFKADENPTEIQVPIMRGTTNGDANVDIVATYNSNVMSSEQTSVSFTNGSNKAFFTIKLGEVKIGPKYTATLSFPASIKSEAGDSVITVTVEKQYSWVNKGIVVMSSEWEGVENVKVTLEQAKEYKDEAGNHYMRLLSPYYFIAKDYCKEEGLHPYFYLDKDYNAVQEMMPQGTQQIEDEAGWYWATKYVGSYLAFVNEANVYYLQILWNYNGGLYGPTVESWEWTEAHYNAAKADPNWEYKE